MLKCPARSRCRIPRSALHRMRCSELSGRPQRSRPDIELGFARHKVSTNEYSFSPNSLLLGVLNSFLRCVHPLCHCWCPPFSAGHVETLFICLPGLSLLVSALFRWPCSISVHVSPRYVTAGVRPFPLAMQHFYSFVSQVCHWWSPPFSAGHVAFLFICLPGLSLLVSALFRWPCSTSVHVSPRYVTAGVRPFPLAMQHFYSFVSQVCHWWSPPFSAGHVVPAGVRPFPLAM